MANTILDDDANLNRMGGHLAQEIPGEEAEVRTPITVSPDGSVGRAPSDSDADSVGDADFWTRWMEEMKSDPPSELLATQCEDEIQMIHALSFPPDPTYYEEPAVCCYEYLHAFGERYSRPTVETLQEGKWQQDVDLEMDRLREKVCGDTFVLAERLAQEPLEFQMPLDMALLSGLIPQQDGGGFSPAAYPKDAHAVLVVDRQGVKKMIIEVSNAQSNAPVSSDDCRKHPELVKAAVLAEIIRWVQNGGLRRQSRKDARNVLSSCYVLTRKR